MANPKRRHSNTRTRLRRTHDFLSPRPLTKCTNCGRLVVTHRICPHCGYYRGRQFVTIAVKTKEKPGASG